MQKSGDYIEMDLNGVGEWWKEHKLDQVEFTDKSSQVKRLGFISKFFQENVKSLNG